VTPAVILIAFLAIVGCMKSDPSSSIFDAWNASRQDPAPYQAIANPNDATKRETGYYSRPVFLQDGQHWIIPSRSTETTDRLLVVYECLEPRHPGLFRRQCGDLQKLALYRSAELTLEHGYELFAVLEREPHEECMQRSRMRPLPLPGQCIRAFYSIMLVIQMLHDPSSDPFSNELYNAKALMDSLPLEVPTLPRSG
jgi:hypothetical protein